MLFATTVKIQNGGGRHLMEFLLKVMAPFCHILFIVPVFGPATEYVYQSVADFCRKREDSTADVKGKS